jgi:hypothetical protein
LPQTPHRVLAYRSSAQNFGFKILKLGSNKVDAIVDFSIAESSAIHRTLFDALFGSVPFNRTYRITITDRGNEAMRLNHDRNPNHAFTLFVGSVFQVKFDWHNDVRV